MSENFYNNTQTAHTQDIATTQVQEQTPQQTTTTASTPQNNPQIPQKQFQPYQNIGLKGCPTAYEAKRKKSMGLEGTQQEMEAKTVKKPAQAFPQNFQSEQLPQQSLPQPSQQIYPQTPYQQAFNTQNAYTQTQTSVPQNQMFTHNSPFFVGTPTQAFLPQSQFQQGINPMGLNSLTPYINLDANQIDYLVKSGNLNAETGLLLKSGILKNTFGNGITSVQAPPPHTLPQFLQQQASQPLQPPQTQNSQYSQPLQQADMTYKSNVLADTTLLNFEQAEPGFFSDTQARNNLKGYLRQVFPTLQKEDLSKIVQIVKDLETQAIEQHSAQANYAKNLNTNNQLATKKLSGTSDKQKTSNIASTKIFTRADIAAMSMEEFKTHHEEILSQYRKRMIK